MAKDGFVLQNKAVFFYAVYLTKAFGTGRSPLTPTWTAVKPLVDCCRYQTAFEGRKTAVSNLPSPS
jgi:hypothetical protein